MNTSHLLVFAFSIMITLAHFLLSILKPQSADLQNLVRPASPASLIVALGRYYAIAALLWICFRSHTSFFSASPSARLREEDQGKETDETARPATVDEETSHYLTFLGIALAASLVIYLEIVRIWYRAMIAAWNFSYLTPNPDIVMKVISNVVFCQIAAATSVTAGIVSLFPSYAMGHILSIGHEARIEFVEKIHRPVEKPWGKRKAE